MLNSEILKLTKKYQIDYFGAADISNHENELIKSGGSIVKGYKYGISIGIILPSAIVDGLNYRFDKNTASLYYTHAYHIINDRLNSAASMISSFLNSKGYLTLPIPAAERTDIENAMPTISHKMIANLSGLGWIGKNCLLITHENGPRVRFSSLLTNAPFKVKNKIVEQKCNNCMECINICPVQAIKGKNFKSTDERSVRFDFKKCHNYYEEMKKDNERKPVCGMCLYICPYGRKK